MDKRTRELIAEVLMDADAGKLVNLVCVELGIGFYERRRAIRALGAVTKARRGEALTVKEAGALLASAYLLPRQATLGVLSARKLMSDLTAVTERLGAKAQAIRWERAWAQRDAQPAAAQRTAARPAPDAKSTHA